MQIFSIKQVPSVSWSSEDPFNLRPRATTAFWLCFGLFLFGLGETLLIAAVAGVSPWTVFAQGIGVQFDLSIGLATLLVGFGVLLLWVPLKQRPGIGTIMNVLIIAATIEYVLPFIPVPESYLAKLAIVAIGILLVGLGSGAYLVANLGPGPRDGLMTGLQRVTGARIAIVRAAIELTVIACGWLMGGVVGLGTVMFALGVGPAVSVGLYLTGHLSNPKRDMLK